MLCGHAAGSRERTNGGLANALAMSSIIKDQDQEGKKGIEQPLASQPLPLLRHQVERAVSNAGWSSKATV